MLELAGSHDPSQQSITNLSLCPHTYPRTTCSYNAVVEYTLYWSCPVCGPHQWSRTFSRTLKRRQNSTEISFFFFMREKYDHVHVWMKVKLVMLCWSEPIQPVVVVLYTSCSSNDKLKQTAVWWWFQHGAHMPKYEHTCPGMSTQMHTTTFTELLKLPFKKIIRNFQYTYKAEG